MLVDGMLAAVGFKLPTSNISGIDWRSVLSFALVVAQMSWAITTFLAPQLTVLENVKAAICAGDRDFVYGVDGMGTIVWGYPPRVAGTIQESIDTGFTEWPTDDTEDLSYNGLAVDSILRGNGRGSCPPQNCYYSQFAPLPPIPLPASERAACCVPTQTKAPSIEYGRYSVQSKTTANLPDTGEMYAPRLDACTCCIFAARLLAHPCARVDFLTTCFAHAGGTRVVLTSLTPLSSTPIWSKARSASFSSIRNTQI